MMRTLEVQCIWFLQTTTCSPLVPVEIAATLQEGQDYMDPDFCSSIIPQLLLHSLSRTSNDHEQYSNAIAIALKEVYKSKALSGQQEALKLLRIINGMTRINIDTCVHWHLLYSRTTPCKAQQTTLQGIQILVMIKRRIRTNHDVILDWCIHGNSCPKQHSSH